MRTLMFSLLVSAIAATGLSAQSVTPNVVASAGGSGTVESVTIMWTVGEVAITTLSGSDLWLTQGFHQPPPGVTSAPSVTVAGAGIELFPNPTSGITRVVLENAPSVDWQIEVVDLLGRARTESSVPAGVSQADCALQDLASGTYLLRVRIGEEVSLHPLVVQR